MMAGDMKTAECDDILQSIRDLEDDLSNLRKYIESGSVRAGPQSISIVTIAGRLASLVAVHGARLREGW